MSAQQVARRRAGRLVFNRGPAGVRLAAALSLWLMLFGLGPGPAGASPGALTLPPGFTDSPVVSQTEPTDLAFLPDGKLVVTTKGGGVRVYGTSDQGQTYTPLTPGWAIHLGSRICWQKERGLLGLAVDPNFTTNRYLYLYYTYDLHGQQSDCPYEDYDNPNNPVNRVSRFTLNANHTLSLSSELVLLDNLESITGNHNAGGLEIGKDGYLYVTVGDNGCHYATGVCSPNNPTARESHHLWGKVLRITLDGGIPPGNPHTGADSDRCHLTGMTTPGRWCQEIAAHGLRNPFRLAMDPNTAGTTTRVFVNDVGQHEYEEINELQLGADYGWPCLEGPYAPSGLPECSPTPPGLTAPVHAYSHDTTGCASVTGGAFVPNGVWPAEYTGAYLYGDYMCGKIFRLNGATAAPFATGMGFSSAIAMTFGPYNGTQALYYAVWTATGGEIRRIAYTASPSAAFTATPEFGAVPLNVAFNGSPSLDPNGLTLTYDWTFGDGSTLNAQSSPAANHVYNASGTYTATLVVRNSNGIASAPASRVIRAGAQPPQAQITLPSGPGYGVGQIVSASGSATDPEDGVLPASALSWSVRLFHVDVTNPGNLHSHPHDSGSGTSSFSFIVPPAEDLQAADLSYLEITLTATDSDGLTGTDVATVYPRRYAVTFNTDPPGLRLTVRELTAITPFTVTLWMNWQVPVAAPAVQFKGFATQWDFEAWSNGQARTHTLSGPSAPLTLLAAYEGSPAETFFFPLLGR